MASFFSSSELIKVAIGIEQRGIVFYETMAHSTENTGARQVFAGLVDVERSHIAVFQSMLSDSDKYAALESHPAGYDDYLKALMNTAVFTDVRITSDQATAAESGIRAVELAIAVEKDSILFYEEMRETVPKQTRSTVEKILREEKSHLRMLADLKKKMDARSSQ